MMKSSSEKPIVLRVAVAAPLYRLFDYLPPIQESGIAHAHYLKGIRVQVPFGRRQVIGVIIETATESMLSLETLKPVTRVLDEKPLWSPTLLNLIEWVSRYYHAPLGETFATALPGLLRRVQTSLKQKKTSNKQSISFSKILFNEKNTALQLNQDQQIVINNIQRHLGHFQVFLLQGVTGSGKTEVYLQLMQQVLAQGQQVLLLVPEISLTPQMLERLQSRFKEGITLFHSRLTPKRRLENWKLAQSGKATVIVGTRSAVFIPFPALGLIILDEEHDSSFKQQTGVQYHARDVAIKRANLEKIPIVLGSATPSLESLWNAEQGRYQKLLLPKRAGIAVLPKIELMDVRRQHLISGLSQALLDEMTSHLQANGQVLLFLNRRGFAPIYLCHGCGWVVMCPYCDSPLRLHRKPLRLRCHYCEHTSRVPTACHECQQEQLFPLGEGTQKLEEVLGDYFPEIPQIRIDADSTRGKDRLNRLLESIPDKKSAILIGTQILAKGHHFPGVTLAAIVDGDAGLFGADFRSLEQAAQLIVQVAGRAGRAEKIGQVIIQTHYPNHPLLKQLIESGYEKFTQLALAERKQANWPPFSYLALLRAEARTQAAALDFLNQVKRDWCNDYNLSINIFGPVPSLLTKRAGYYRAQLLFQSSQRSALHNFLNYLMGFLEKIPKAPIRWSLEVDPLEIC